MQEPPKFDMLLARRDSEDTQLSAGSGAADLQERILVLQKVNDDLRARIAGLKSAADTRYENAAQDKSESYLLTTSLQRELEAVRGRGRKREEALWACGSD